MDIKLNQILNMLDDLSSTELQSVMMRAKVLSEKKKKEEEELREQERIRQEKIAQEKLRQEKIAELQREIQELQNQEVVIPEGSFKAKGSTFVMYDANDPSVNPAAAPSEPADPVQNEPKSEPVICQNCHQANTPGSGFCIKCGSKLSEPKPADPIQDKPKNEPIICPNCHQANTPGSGFCLKCGSKLSEPKPADLIQDKPKSEPVICPNCRQSNAPGSGFCLKCGYKFSNPQPQPQPQPQPAPKPEGVLCPNCHTANPANSAFCLSCGQKISQSRSETVPEPASTVFKPQEPSPQVRYIDESVSKWEMIPDEKTVLIKHETALIQPKADKKSVYYIEITNKRILISKESSIAKNARVAMGVGGGLVGALIAEGVSAASGKGPKPYLEIPLAAITDCGLQSKKEFFICAGETFVFKNNKYEKFVPDLVREAKM